MPYVAQELDSLKFGVASPPVDEAVANAAKHSEATKVDVRLTNVGDIATLSIVDNGKWQHGPEGLGIATVRGMLEAVGGDLEIRTKTGIGTTVVAQAPLKEQHQ